MSDEAIDEMIDTALHPERNGLLIKERIAEGASHEWLVKRELKAVILAEIQKQVTLGKIEGRITGLQAAHRYKGNPFEIGEKILKEIARLGALQAELKDKVE